MAVGGNCQIKFLAVERAQLSQITNKIHQAVAQQRLAAGEPDFLDAGLNEDPHQAQVVSKRQFRILRAFIAGAAIDALVIAAVRDADAQVSDKASVLVLKPHMLLCRSILADEVDLQGHEKEGKTPKRVSVPFQTGGPCVSAPDPRPCILSKEPPHWPGIPEADVVGTYLPIIERKVSRRTLNVLALGEARPYSHSTISTSST